MKEGGEGGREGGGIETLKERGWLVNEAVLIMNLMNRKRKLHLR